MQYREVANLTVTRSANDVSTPFTTLPMLFTSASTREFVVPISVLKPGVYYEFRLGFPFTTHTYYTNSMLAKTFGPTSRVVANVVIKPSDTAVRLSWDAPENTIGFVGYRLAVYYSKLRNGAAKPFSPDADTRGLALFSSIEIVYALAAATFGCTNRSEPVPCLTPYTHYLMYFSVLRADGPDDVRTLPFTTLHDLQMSNSSALFLYGATLALTLTTTLPVYANTPLGASLLYPVYLNNTNGDVTLALSEEGTVNSVSPSSVRISLVGADYDSLRAQLLAASLEFSPFSLFFGQESYRVPVSIYCLCSSPHC